MPVLVNSALSNASMQLQRNQKSGSARVPPALSAIKCLDDCQALHQRRSRAWTVWHRRIAGAEHRARRVRQPVFTVIFRGVASGRRCSLIVNTPFLNDASTLFGSTEAGSVTLREKAP